MPAGATTYEGKEGRKMRKPFRDTRSVCPVCLRPVKAQLCREEEAGAVFLQKSCPSHGAFSVPVWRGKVPFDQWTANAKPLGPEEGLYCPSACGICPEHGQGTCCVLLEVTRRCDLFCQYCFANGGGMAEDPPLDELKRAVDDILRQCGKPLLQLSGGEPSLRDDLPELIAYARKQGCETIQLNTNGLRLAREPEYAARLAEAGLSIVFLQFDGVSDQVYETLRGAKLYEEKMRAIENCNRVRTGVTLVPTVVRGVNDQMLGEIIRLGASLSPAVRGVHFQPVSHFGRYPVVPQDGMRITLDELIDGICRQTGLSLDVFQPSCCDHPLCGFHISALASPCCCGVKPLPVSRQGAVSTAEQNRDYIARRWQRGSSQDGEDAGPLNDPKALDMNAFLRLLRTRSFTITAMAFQDVWNLDIERLHRCSLHVYNKGMVKPFCANYLTAAQAEN